MHACLSCIAFGFPNLNSADTNIESRFAKFNAHQSYLLYGIY